MDNKKKLLIIGIDGGTFDVILPMIKENKLPNLSSFIAGGSYGRLLSTIPPVTAPAWSSFITGTSPGSHGIFYFFENNINQYDFGSAKKLISLHDMRGIPFWRILNQKGIKTGLINIPLTYPPDAVDGFMISGMLVPQGVNNYVYPPGIISSLEDYSVDLDGLMEQNEWRGKALINENREKFIENVWRLSRNRTHNALKLMKQESWDLFMVVFTGSDRISHFFWEDPVTGENPSSIVRDYYSFLDEQIGKLISAAGEDTFKIILSDHGFGTAPSRRVNAFVLLKELGYTAFSPGSKFDYVQKRLLGKIGIKKEIEKKDFVDWKRSKVFAVPLYNNFIGICINTKDEKKCGIVSPGNEYESLKIELISRLRDVTDPDSGEKIVTGIYNRDEVYHGNHVKEAPDIIVQFSYDYKVNFNPIKTRLTETKKDLIKTGDHRREGIFIASGAVIKPGPLDRELLIQDVTPSILHLMGVPIPVSYDGRLINELFPEGYLSKHPPRYEEADQALRLEEKRIASPADADFQKSKELLRNLGYM